MRTTVHLPRLFQSGMLLLLTAAFIHLVISHGINMLVAPFIAVIVKVSIVLFGVVGLITLASSVSIGKQASRSSHLHVRHDSLEMEHNHVALGSGWGRTTAVLLFASLGLALTWHPHALGTEMIANLDNAKGTLTIATSANGSPQNSSAAGQWSAPSWAAVVSNSPGNYSSGGAGQQVPGQQGIGQQVPGQQAPGQQGIGQQVPGQISEATIAVDYGSEKSIFIGRRVTMEGFVYHPKGLPNSSFILTRYFIFCCIADACPIGVVVEGSNSADLKNDQWVMVSGVIREQNAQSTVQQYQPTSWYPTNGQQPVIVADKIEPIAVPEDPYMVPTY